jgi:hypothetical protein
MASSVWLEFAARSAVQWELTASFESQTNPEKRMLGK